jgi:hypothetical protein
MGVFYNVLINMAIKIWVGSAKWSKNWKATLITLFNVIFGACNEM